jgi:hypothetical protein
LLEDVKDLVGELDFSYHVVSTTDDAEDVEETVTFGVRDREQRQARKGD